MRSFKANSQIWPCSLHHQDQVSVKSLDQVVQAGGQEKWTPSSQRWPARIGFQVHGSRVQKADLAFHSSSSTLPKSSLSLTSNQNRTYRWTCCDFFYFEVYHNNLTRNSGYRLYPSWHSMIRAIRARSPDFPFKVRHSCCLPFDAPEYPSGRSEPIGPVCTVDNAKVAAICRCYRFILFS